MIAPGLKLKRRSFLFGSLAFSVIRSPASAGVPRLAIHVFSDGTAAEAVVDRLTNALAGRLIRSRKFEVVDRNRLDTIIREQGFSNSSYADPNTAAALGKLAGASRILSVTVSVDVTDYAGSLISMHSVQITASYSLVGVDTGRVLDAGSAQGAGRRQTPAGAPSPVPVSQLEREAMDACCDDLVDQLTDGGA